ncbi:AAA family ATPase [Elizabethkingia anophelis]|nr:AAA family ATPase [Elizabethkingia anophelis]ELB1892650.1 AAA family ATPase [Elizabethkingia anophelis]MCT3641865.1 AAA family ATPase [Elizabethkingia anophelis]MCT3727282.1 AAA family ATPase [Elizabethkingia anophelis]MCT3964431.1 AAA family ATPase [Elizabethkingia anophelis]
MTFKDILQAYNDSNTTRQEIKHNTKLSGLARQHSSYFIRVVNKFIAFLAKQNKIIEKHEIEKVTLKNYILIIDEINRANLSSVLGELIYALEYRGESVNSIYAVENSVLSNKNHLILPPNLFIIGTMNTADRSVGHIDYAIRRRFAFIDVLPKNLSTDDTIKFDSELFISIKNLFTTDDYKTRSVYLSNEFEPKDVALGHSYFIDKSDEGGSMAIRLEYEIKPILLEYIKDGILIGEDIKEKINSLQASI